MYNCKSRKCEIGLGNIKQVIAVKRGLDKANMDMTFYALILEMHSGQRCKVLETKSIRKIQKELLCVRKFLGFKDFELTIVDETKLYKKRMKQERFG